MKANILFIRIITALLLAGATTYPGGYATAGTETTAATASVQTVETDIRRVADRTDAIGQALQDLLRPDQPDPKKACERFASSLAGMEDLAVRLDTHVNRMNALGMAYFAGEKTGDAHPRILRSNVGVGSALHAYMTYLMETQMYLARNPSAAGIQTIAPVVRKAVRGGVELKEALAPMLSAAEQRTGRSSR